MFRLFLGNPSLVGPAFRLVASANIAGSAATSTTAQLTAPGSKSSGVDFEAGRISDDTNPLPSLDLGADAYTEVEWCIEATDDAVDAEEYEFRVTDNGTPIDTYSATPEWTIGSGAGAAGARRRRILFTA